MPSSPEIIHAVGVQVCNVCLTDVDVLGRGAAGWRAWFLAVHGRGGGAVQSHESLNPQADPVHLPSSLLVKFLMPLLQEVALDALKGEGNWGIISETQAFRADHRLGCHAFRGL